MRYVASYYLMNQWSLWISKTSWRGSLFYGSFFLGFFIFSLLRYLEYGMVGIFAPYLFGGRFFGKVGGKQISINFGLTWDHKSD